MGLLPAPIRKQQEKLFDLLFQIIKNRRGEKVQNRNFQSVANLLNGRNRGRGITTAYNVIQS